MSSQSQKGKKIHFLLRFADRRIREVSGQDCQNVKKHNLENNVLAINAAVSHESKQSQYIINPKNMGDCRGHVFENELFELVREIYDPSVPFIDLT